MVSLTRSPGSYSLTRFMGLQAIICLSFLTPAYGRAAGYSVSRAARGRAGGGDQQARTRGRGPFFVVLSFPPPGGGRLVTPCRGRRGAGRGRGTNSRGLGRVPLCC